MPEEKRPESALSRRQLLKTLAATGGAVAASALLPDKWVKPAVEMAVLPAHAQELSETPVTIVTCHLANTIEGITEITPFDTVETYVTIRTERADIESIPLIMTLSVLRQQQPTPETLHTETGTATITPQNDPNEATFQPQDVDLTPFGLAAGDTLTATFAFVNPQDGEDTCVRSSVLVRVN